MTQTPPPNTSTSPSPDNQEQEVDVTEDIQNLLKYVTKKSEDDPHDGVLSRIKSRMKDIVESLIGDTPSTSPTSPNNQPPTTPTVTIPDLPQWTFVRKRGGRIVKRSVKKQEVAK